MRIIETKAFQYEELKPAAQAKARDWYRAACEGDNYFAESVIQDAAEIAALLGVTMLTRDGRPGVSWSGFWCQGDGASFEGQYATVKTSALDAVKAHAPQDEALHAIAARLDAIKPARGYRLVADISTHGNYCHSGTMAFDVEGTDADGEPVEVAPEVEKELGSAIRAFADWIYRQLETEFDWHNADDQVAESIGANEYEFTEAGKRICI